MQRKRAGEIALLAAALLLIAALTTMQASLTASEQSVPSTFDTGRSGYAALYEFLAREGVRVERYELPISQIFSRRGTLVITDALPGYAISPYEQKRRALDPWVKEGSTLVLLGAPPADAGKPYDIDERASAGGCGLAPAARSVTVAGDFRTGLAADCRADRTTLLRAGKRAVAVAVRRGKGTIVYVTTPTVFDNLHLAQRGNAAFAFALLGNGGAVAFDERIYGHAAGNSFWSVLPLPMRVAFILALAGVLAAIAGANLPFAPPYETRSKGERDSSEYIASLARMLESGGAQREVVARLCAQVLTIVSPLAGGDALAALLAREARALLAVPNPGAHDVTAAGRLFARARKEYAW